MILSQTELISSYQEILKLFRQYLEKRLKIKPESSHLTLTQDKAALLKQLATRALECQKCPLYRTRTNLVFGGENSNAQLMLVGEAPGREEDLRGVPFVGAAGKLLEESFKINNLSRTEVYIANILKCHPPNNRNPQPEEISACLPYLKKQIEIIHPRIICTLGKFATQILLNRWEKITDLRGKVYLYEKDVYLIPTFHPAACIYRPGWKNTFINDLKLVREKLKGVKE